SRAGSVALTGPLWDTTLAHEHPVPHPVRPQQGEPDLAHGTLPLVFCGAMTGSKVGLPLALIWHLDLGLLLHHTAGAVLREEHLDPVRVEQRRMLREAQQRRKPQRLGERGGAFAP